MFERQGNRCKYAFGEAKSIVCPGGPRAVVVANHNGSSIGTSADATARIPPILCCIITHLGGIGIVLAISKHKKLGKLQMRKVNQPIPFQTR